MEMRIGVCGIACERCPRMMAGGCPGGPEGCVPRENPFCEIATCAFNRGERHCFACERFPCETTRHDPITFRFCLFISGKEGQPSGSSGP